MRFVKLWYEYAKTVDEGMIREGMRPQHQDAWDKLYAAIRNEGLTYTNTADGIKLSNGDVYKHSEPL